MSRHALFILDEATVSLYPASNDGGALIDNPIWIGACAESLRLNAELEPFELAATGARYRQIYHTDERHRIDIERLWVLPLDTLRDYELVRNQQYALHVVWENEKTGLWHKREYCGVTQVNWDLASNGVMEFGGSQGFVAQHYTQSSDFGAVTPLPLLCQEDQQLGFFRADPSALGDYFLGHYRFGRSVELISASVVATQNSTVDPTELTLEINGTLSVHTLTLATGAGEQTDELIFNSVTVPANQPLRWKVTAAPIGESNQITHAAVVLRVR